MPMYESFARVYDTFMDNVPYDEWAGWIRSALTRAGITDGLILDLGCGTGNMTQRLSLAGYDMIGVDASSEMLQIAQEKRIASGTDILYLCQDMCEFELYGTVRGVISICDSLNYILEPDRLCRVFALVHNYLDPGGVFLFDLNTEYKFQNELADHTFAESREDCSFIWDNYYDPEERINEYELTLFLREERDRYRRFQELHCQRAYPLKEVLSMLERAGLKVTGVYGDYTDRPPRPDEGRVCIEAVKPG